MSSVDGAKSVHASSDQLFDHICGSCKTDGKENEARKYCQDCEEYLCGSCVSFHRKLPLLRNHNVVDAGMSPGGSPGTRRLKDYCSCNTNQEVEFYCEDHSDFICSTCKSIKHHKCTTPSVQQKSLRYNPASLDLILAKTKSLKDAYERLKQECQENDKELECSKEACKEEIQAFRKELGDFLNKLEQQMLAELDQIARKERQRIEKRIDTLSTFIEMLGKQHASLEKAQQDGSKENMFVAETRNSTNLRDYQTRLDDLEKNHSNVRLTFERDSKLDAIQSCVEALGTLQFLEKERQKKQNELLGRQIQSCRKVNVRLADDKKDPIITGCVFMPNGYLVVCDYKNHNIKLLDSSLALHDNLKLPSYTYGVSVIDDSTVIVTIPSMQQLQYIQVFPKLILKNAIQLDQYCWGVAVYGQEIYVSCHDYHSGEVRVLDKHGNLKRRLGRREGRQYLFVDPYYLTVNKAGDKIFVSDEVKNTITCMRVDGSIVYQYKDKDLQKPAGLLCDDSDNVMVCDWDSKKIHVITSEGKKYGTLSLPSQNEKDTLSCLAYRKSDNMLLVGYERNDHMLACQLT